MTALDFLSDQYAKKLRSGVSLDWSEFQSLVLGLSVEAKASLLQAVNNKDGSWMMNILWTDIQADIQQQVSDARAQVESQGSVTIAMLNTLIGD